MPNGISCAYFAAKNHICGQNEHNFFKEGIACAQTTRTLDSVAQTGIIKGPLAKPLSSFFNKAAFIAKKAVYPLIIASGIYNTAVSKDKVKTGVTQAAGIGTMYTFEKLAEKGLNIINQKILNTDFVKGNKAAKAGVYVVKGAAFVAASLSGYTAGTKAGEKVVNTVRGKRQDTQTTVKNQDNVPLEDGFKPDNTEPFTDMEL